MWGPLTARHPAFVPQPATRSGVLPETIRIDAVPTTVIVVAARFAGLQMDYANQLMLPLSRSQTRRAHAGAVPETGLVAYLGSSCN
jgi:hypothetical protein